MNLKLIKKLINLNIIIRNYKNNYFLKMGLHADLLYNSTCTYNELELIDNHSDETVNLKMVCTIDTDKMINY